MVFFSSVRCIFQPGRPKKPKIPSLRGKIWPPPRFRVTEVTMDLARIVSPSKSNLVPSRRLLLAAGCAFLSFGCAMQKGQSTPAWPEQPSPSYPDPSGQTGERPAKADFDDTKDSEGSDTPPSSSLAKEYDGKAALETLSGKATYYADSLAGNHTANGDVYDPKEFTAAHKKLPFGTIVRVVRQDTGAVTYARINDRGPFGPHDRIIDLSRAAATELEMMKAGVVDVRVEIVDRPMK